MPSHPVRARVFLCTASVLPLSMACGGMAVAQVTIPSATVTQQLQVLDPVATDYVAPAATTIATTSGAAIAGDATRNWSLTNAGSLTGAVSGVTLATATANAGRFENSGSIHNNSATAGGASAGVKLASGGVMFNRSTGVITSASDGVYVSIAGAQLTNEGRIQGAAAASTVYFNAGGAFTQTSTGVLQGGYGLVFNGGAVGGSNAGSIDVSRNGLWVRSGAVGSFVNTGAIRSTGAGFDGLRVGVNSTLTLTGSGTLSASGEGSIAAHATSSNARLTANGVSIDASGALGRAVQADDGAIVTLGADGAVRSTVTGSNASAIGLVTTSGVINASNTDVTTLFHSAIAQGAGVINLGVGATFTTTSSLTVGLGAHGGGQITSTAPTTVTLAGAADTTNSRVAAYMHDGGRISLAPGSTLVVARGSGTGLTVDNTQLPIASPLVNLNIRLDGPASVGSTGVFATNGGVVAFNGLTIQGGRRHDRERRRKPYRPHRRRQPCRDPVHRRRQPQL